MNVWSQAFLKEIALNLVEWFQPMFKGGNYYTNLLAANLVRSVPLWETLVIMDGSISAIKFAKEYFLYKISETKVEATKNIKYKQEMVKQCNSLYRLGGMDRYVMYFVAYVVNLLVSSVMRNLEWGCSYYFPQYETSWCYQMCDNILYLSMCSLTIPTIQNWILMTQTDVVNNLQEHKITFLRYSLSKLIVKYIGKLDSGVGEIKNYHIFMLYDEIKFENLYEFVKSYALIYLLVLLRGWESTYYYYKAIKFAYYYNTGFLYNKTTRQDAVYIINVIVQEKRWRDLSKIEVVSAIYSLIDENMQGRQLDYSTETQILLLKALTVWSVVCVLKLFSIYFNTIILFIYLIGLWYSLEHREILNLTQSEIMKKVFTVMIVYSLVILNINDIIISLVFISSEWLYYGSEEITFYLRNHRDIQKVVKFYRKGKIKKWSNHNGDRNTNNNYSKNSVKS
jgi:hypothetical protein